jgi:thioredoxin 1
MSTICIGGICIPYTALFPFLVYCLKWLWQKAQAVLLKNESNMDKNNQLRESCCAQSSSDTPGKAIIKVSNDAHWKSVVGYHAGPDSVVVAQFTANWCRPCHKIAPVVTELASNNATVQVVVVDVDACKGIADEYKAAILPTFVCLRQGKEVARYTGSDANKLEAWFKENA